MFFLFRREFVVSNDQMTQFRKRFSIRCEWSLWLEQFFKKIVRAIIIPELKEEFLLWGKKKKWDGLSSAADKRSNRREIPSSRSSWIFRSWKNFIDPSNSSRCLWSCLSSHSWGISQESSSCEWYVYLKTGKWHNSYEMIKKMFNDLFFECHICTNISRWSSIRNLLTFNFDAKNSCNKNLSDIHSPGEIISGLKFCVISFIDEEHCYSNSVAAFWNEHFY